MKYIIVITLFFADPTYSGNDAVRVLEKYNKPLEFSTVSECGSHIKENLDELKAFALTVYPKATAVKQILCALKGKEI